MFNLMLLCKIMVNQADDVARTISYKAGLKYRILMLMLYMKAVAEVYVKDLSGTLSES
jgi:hypothetical protein